MIGSGSLEQSLSDAELTHICEECLLSLPVEEKSVLVLIPDHTRHARIGLFFRILHGLLGSRVKTLDFLIATGTHAPMEVERIYAHLGAGTADLLPERPVFQS